MVKLKGTMGACKDCLIPTHSWFYWSASVPCDNYLKGLGPAVLVSSNQAFVDYYYYYYYLTQVINLYYCEKINQAETAAFVDYEGEKNRTCSHYKNNKQGRRCPRPLHVYLHFLIWNRQVTLSSHKHNLKNHFNPEALGTLIQI
jgi:hypothetical protein